MEAFAQASRAIPLFFGVTSRLRALFASVALLLVALGWSGLMVNVWLGHTHASTGGRWLGLALAGVSVPFGVWAWQYWRRVIAAPPELLVQGDRLVVRHDVVLRGPVSIPRDLIAGLCVDEQGARIGQDELRFPLLADTSAAGSVGVSRWLYSRYSGAPMPMLAEPEEIPNVAVMLRGPTFIEGARLGRKRPLQVNGGRLGLYRNQPVIGLLLRVEEPDRLRQNVAGWGVLRPVLEGDLVAVAGIDSYPTLNRTEETPPTSRLPAVGGLPRSRSRLLRLAAACWLAAMLVRASQDSESSIALIVGFTVVWTARRLEHQVAARSTSSGSGVFWVRAMLLYPGFATVTLAVVLLIAQPAGRLLAWSVLPGFVTAVLVLADASGQRASSGRRVMAAIASGCCAFTLSAILVSTFF